MIKFIRKKLYSDNVWSRIAMLICIFCLAFFGVTIISYYLLPKGFLSNQSNMKDFETSTSLLVCTLQIFFFNMISVLCILVASIFSRKKGEIYVSSGYYCFVLFVIIKPLSYSTLIVQ